MNQFFEKEHLITAAYADRNCRLSVYQASMVMQDAMSELFYSFGCDGPRIFETSRGLWAFARSKLHLSSFPQWMETVRVRSFPVKVTPVSVHLNIVVETLAGQPVFQGRQELCVLDADDHSLRRLETVPYPVGLPLLPPAYTAAYLRMRTVFGPEDFVYAQRVLALDTDMNHHMNNIAYVRAIMNAFPAVFWDKNQVTDFDIHYVSEGREGEELQVFRKDTPDGAAVLVKVGERTLVKAFLKTDRLGDKPGLSQTEGGETV